MLADGGTYVVAATDNQTSQPYLYRVTLTGSSTPMVNLQPWFDYGQVTGITKLGSDYFVSSRNRIVRVTTDGTVFDVAQNGKSIEGLTNDGTSLVVGDFSGPNLMLVATSTVSAH